MGYEKNDTDTFVCGAAAFGLRPGGRHGGNHLGDAPAAVTETTAQTSAPKTTPGGVDKAETVYAKADADGTVTETTVEAVLKARDGATIEDVAALRDIINKEGDEAYTTGADNALTWENSGNAITYAGKSDAALPVTTRVTYYLNGVETAPADLAGQSGRVRHPL